MTDAVDALRADSEVLVAAASNFTPADWATPSSCAGWTVQDVIAHMSALWRQITDPGSLPLADPSGDTERTQDRWVESMRSMSGTEVLAAYQEHAGNAMAGLEGLRGNDTPMDLGDLGTYPMGMIANAFSFDHYTHLRADIFGPIGPIGTAPESDALRLGPAMDWMVAGIPQMCTEAVASIPSPVTLDLSGPGGRTVTFPADSPDGPEASVATVTTPTTDFVLWGTKRRDWRELDVALDGDVEIAAAFCDAIRVF